MKLFTILRNMITKAKAYTDTAEQNTKYYIDQTQATDSYNLSFNSGFSSASWGFASVSTYGKFCVVSFYGFRSNRAITGDTVCTTLNSGTYSVVGGCLTAGSSTSDVIMRTASNGDVYVNNMQANVNYYGQLTCVKIS